MVLHMYQLDYRKISEALYIEVIIYIIRHK